MEFIIGVFIGGLLYWLFIDRKKASGVFTIDLSDPMNDDICVFTLYENLNDLSMKKRMIIDIKTIFDDSPN